MPSVLSAIALAYPVHVIKGSPHSPKQVLSSKFFLGLSRSWKRDPGSEDTGAAAFQEGQRPGGVHLGALQEDALIQREPEEGFRWRMASRTVGALKARA